MMLRFIGQLIDNVGPHFPLIGELPSLNCSCYSSIYFLNRRRREIHREQASSIGELLRFGREVVQ